MTTLRLKDVTAGYEGTHIVHQIGLELSVGERLVILGPNGAGKSTLLKVIAGLLRIARGTLLIDDIDLTTHSIRDRSRAGIRWVGDPRPIFSELTVEENLMMGGYMVRRSLSERERVYEIFPGLVRYRRSKVGGLSGGEQQMVAIGQSLMSKPKFICLDEPSNGLALALFERVADAIDLLARDGTGIIWCEQFPEIALAHCDKAAILAGGYLTEPGPPIEMTDDKLRSAYLGTAAAEADSGSLD